MNRPIVPRSPDEQRVYAQRHTAAMKVAFVAALFTAAVIVTLAMSFAHGKRSDPLESAELRALKEQLKQQPKSDEVKAKIRDLDAKLRDTYFLRQSRAVRGAWLLLAGAGVFVLALHVGSRFRPTPPSPPKAAGNELAVAREGAWSRGAVAAAAVLIVGGGVALLLGPYAVALPETKTEAAAAVVAEPPASEVEMAVEWPRFRGPGGLGVSPHKNLPEKWDGKTGENIHWKVEVPLSGHSSPIVWGKRIFVTGANEAQRELYCFDADSGAIVWRKKLENVPDSSGKQPKVGEETGFASCTPATDGRRIYVIYANGDFGAFDFTGRQLWARSFGVPKNRYGHAASLLTYRNLLIVPWDQEASGRMVALDGATGKTVWEVSRNLDSGWTTPVVLPVASGDQLITCVNPKLMAYEVLTGKPLWSVSGLEGDVAASPVYGQGLVFATSPHNIAVAVKPDGKGDVTKTHVVWQTEECLPDTCSPVTDGTRVWTLVSEGALNCLDFKTGKPLYTKDLEERFYPSPSIAAGKLFLISVAGHAYYIEAASEFKLLGKMSLGEEVFATPAFQDGRIYIRAKKHLYCIGAGGGAKP
jgi:outer membrane protein assembly factor BamB